MMPLDEAPSDQENRGTGRVPESPERDPTNMQRSVQNLTNTLVPAGLNTPDALHQGLGRIHAGIHMRAQTLAYIDPSGA